MGLCYCSIWNVNPRNLASAINHTEVSAESLHYKCTSIEAMEILYKMSAGRCQQWSNAYFFIITVCFMIQELKFIECIFSKFYVILIGILEFVLRFEVCCEDDITGWTNGVLPGVHIALKSLQIFISSNVDIYKGVQHQCLLKVQLFIFILELAEAQWDL